MTISLENVTLEVDGARVLKDVSLSISHGEFVALVGPNGAGKTSLMKCALGAATPTHGKARIGDDAASTMDPITRARRIAYLPQSRPTAWPLIVEVIVALGRYAYGTPTDQSKSDAVNAAIAACGLDHLRRRQADQLSGGELARVHCARAFAAEAPFLFADEPTNSLDPAGQLNVMTLIRAHVAGGAGALVILHDVNLAAMFADRIVWMKQGEIIADGSPQETLTAARMLDVFNVSATVAGAGGVLSVSYSAQ